MRTLAPDKLPLKWFRTVATIFVLSYAAYYVYANFASFRVLLGASWTWLVLMLMFQLLTIYASSSENAVLYRALGAAVGSTESFRLTNLSAFANLVLPQGGSLTKALYLKQKHGIPYAKTSASFLGLFVIYLLIASGVLLVTNLSTILLGGAVPLLLWVVALLACASGLLFLFDVPLGPLRGLGTIGALLSGFSDGWKSLRMDRKQLLKACLWQLATFMGSGLYISTAYGSLGMKMNVLLAVSLSVLISLTNIIVIVPGNLGIQEAAYGYLSYLSGMVFAEGVVVGVLVRVGMLLLTLLLAPPAWYYLIYRQKLRLRVAPPATRGQD